MAQPDPRAELPPATRLTSVHFSATSVLYLSPTPTMHPTIRFTGILEHCAPRLSEAVHCTRAGDARINNIMSGGNCMLERRRIGGATNCYILFK